MTKKIFTYISSVVVLTFMTLFQVMATSHAHQWNYVSKVIQAKQHELATGSSKLGSCLSDGAVFLSMPIGALAALQGATASQRLALFSNNRQTNFFVGGIVGGTAGSLVAYSLFKAIGKLLEAHPSLAKKILLAYIAEWKVHKRNTPDTLHPMFESMHVGFMRDANLSSVSEQQAYQIVESLLSVSVFFVEAAK